MKRNCTNLFFWASILSAFITLIAGVMWYGGTTVILPKPTLVIGIIPLFLAVILSFRTAFVRVLLRKLQQNYTSSYEVVKPVQFGFLLLFLTGLLVNSASVQAQSCN